MTRVVLVAVEVMHDPATGERVDLAAQQWAQEIRFRSAFSGAETGAAVAVSIDGTMHTLADALRAASQRTT